MKIIVNILFVLVLISCGQVEQKINTQEFKQDTIKSENEIVRHSIGEIVPPINLPEGFRLDTIQKNDTTRNLSIFISIPVSGIKTIDKIVFEYIDKQKKDFIKSLDEMIKDNNGILSSINSDFQAEPISVFKNNKVTSILYIISYYHGGSVHPMTMYYSFNFDNSTQKTISFTDYFMVKTKADTTSMTELISKSIGREGIFVYDLKGIDFNIEKDTISFNFDDYEIASYSEGIMQARIPSNKLHHKIKLKYQ